MKKRELRKLTLSKETLHRLEDRRLRQAAAAADGIPCPESISYCITQLCASAGFTHCVECDM